MPDYALTGKKGTGKSKNAVRMIRDDYLSEGFKVATNLDIYLSPMFGPHSKKTYVRVPDKPTSFDLLAAGHGNPDSYDEDKNGGLFLDELATWMNTRTFGDKDRSGTLDFFAHGRKMGWNTFYIMQNIAQVDKQLRESFIEFTVRHVRFDKVRIPFFGWIICALFGKKAGYLPRFHRAVTRLGYNPQDVVTDATMFRGDDIHKCYDTRQIFREDYPHGTHSVLSPWHVEGRYMEQPKKHWFVRLMEWRKKPPRKPTVPLLGPSPQLARVIALAQRLEPAEALRIVAMYTRSEAVRRGCVSVPLAPTQPSSHNLALSLPNRT